MKILIYIGKVILVVLILLNLGILISRKTYLYKAILYRDAGIEDCKIFSNRTVKKGIAVALPKAVSYNTTELPPQTMGVAQEMQSVAFLVLKNDSIYYEKYWDGYNEHSLSNSFSMAKSIVSTLIGIAIDEGKIASVEQSVGTFLPAFREGEKARIKIRHLLTMSSGTDWDESYSSPFSITTEAYYGTDLRATLAKVEVCEDPGKVFRYKSGDTQLLGLVLEEATGMSLSEYASEKLWKPIGASHDATWSLDFKNGIEKAYCCFNTNARDFARIGLLYLHQGMANDKQVVSENYIQSATTAATLVGADGKQVDYYGYQWWLCNYKGEKVMYMRGILGQYVIVVPGRQLVIVRLGHKYGDKRDQHREDFYAYLDGVLRTF